MPRPPKPTAILELQGTARKHRHATRIDFQTASEGLPEPPDWLPEEGKAQWDRVTRGYQDMGVLTLLDFPALTALCALWARFVEAETSKPYVPMAPAAVSGMINLMGRLGLDPVNRARLKAPNAAPKKPSGDKPDPWAAITAAARPGAEDDRATDA